MQPHAHASVHGLPLAFLSFVFWSLSFARVLVAGGSREDRHRHRRFNKCGCRSRLVREARSDIVKWAPETAEWAPEIVQWPLELAVGSALARSLARAHTRTCARARTRARTRMRARACARTLHSGWTRLTAAALVCTAWHVDARLGVLIACQLGCSDCVCLPHLLADAQNACSCGPQGWGGQGWGSRDNREARSPSLP